MEIYTIHTEEKVQGLLARIATLFLREQCEVFRRIMVNYAVNRLNNVSIRVAMQLGKITDIELAVGNMFD